MGRNEDWSGFDEPTKSRLILRDLDRLEARLIDLENTVHNDLEQMRTAVTAELTKIAEKTDARLARISGVLIGVLCTVAGGAVLLAIQVGLGR